MLQPFDRLFNAWSPVCLQEISQKEFSWTKQWYPVASVFDLHDSRPHAVMLMGACQPMRKACTSDRSQLCHSKHGIASPPAARHE